MLRLILLFIIGILSPLSALFAGSVSDDDINLRTQNSESTISENSRLSDFVNSIDGGLIRIDKTGEEGVWTLIFRIAYEIKNIIIWIAVIFLLVGVLELLVSEKEGMKKWKDRIVYTSLGVIFLQSVFAIWSALIMGTNETLGSGFAWRIVTSIIFPIVGILQMFASFAFIAMAIYAFYNIVTSGYDDGARKKGLQIFLYACVGFLLIRLPEPLVRAIYGNPTCTNTGPFSLGTIGDCAISKGNLNDAIGLVGKLINFLNSFIAIVCVLLVIWAGWLILTSRGEGDGLKKARSIILYIALGLLLLVASHAIFRFFILKG